MNDKWVEVEKVKEAIRARDYPWITPGLLVAIEIQQILDSLAVERDPVQSGAVENALFCLRKEWQGSGTPIPLSKNQKNVIESAEAEISAIRDNAVEREPVETGAIEYIFGNFPIDEDVDKAREQLEALKAEIERLTYGVDPTMVPIGALRGLAIAFVKETQSTLEEGNTPLTDENREQMEIRFAAEVEKVIAYALAHPLGEEISEGDYADDPEYWEYVKQAHPTEEGK